MLGFAECRSCAIERPNSTALSRRGITLFLIAAARGHPTVAQVPRLARIVSVLRRRARAEHALCLAALTSGTPTMVVALRPCTHRSCSSWLLPSDASRTLTTTAVFELMLIVGAILLIAPATPID